jgi:hypothetical protein
MPKINLITPPDKLFNDNVDILLIHPSDYIKKELQEILKSIEYDLNIYLYEDTDTNNYDWLLSIVHIAKIAILDCDNLSNDTKKIESYIVGKNNVFWLTKGDIMQYNLISNKRIYNLDWLKGEVDNYVKT